MAEKAVVILICDLCGTEDGDVETRTMGVMGKTWEAENCAACWGKILAAIGGWARTAREVRPKRPRAPKAVEWPDTDWRFTHHALQRLGERMLTPSEVLWAINNPDLTRPGRQDEQEIRQRNGVKAVVIPERRIIVTVAGSDDELGEDDK